MQHPLTLRLVRLRSQESYSLGDSGLCFVLPNSGVGKYLCGPFDHAVNERAVMVVEAGIGGSMRATGGELSFWLFTVRAEHLYPLFSGHEIAALQQVVEGFKAPVIHPPTSDISRNCHILVENAPPRYNLEHRSQLLRVASSVLADEFEKAMHRRSGLETAEERIVDVFEKLTPDELLDLSVGDLALKFGCSRRHLNRLFHQCFGLSVAAMRMEMRLLNAISLLRNSTAKIINVAEKCGFNHLGLFNTCFRKRFGVSPGEWRKQAALREANHGPAGPEGCPLHSKGLCPMAGGAATAPTQPNPIMKKVLGSEVVPGLLPVNHVHPKSVGNGKIRVAAGSAET